MDNPWTERELYERGCRHKIKYVTRSSAREHARLYRRRTGFRLHQYPCEFCGCWHNTHQRQDRESA